MLWHVPISGWDVRGHVPPKCPVCDNAVRSPAESALQKLLVSTLAIGYLHGVRRAAPLMDRLETLCLTCLKLRTNQALPWRCTNYGNIGTSGYPIPRLSTTLSGALFPQVNS